MHTPERIAEFLLDIEAVKLSVTEPFTWTSGIQSPIYCDNRMLYSHPAARSYVVDALAMRVKNLHIPADIVAGTATAAIGWAALVADRLSLPFVYVRSKPKEHGAKKRIEGDLKPDQHIVVIEDLISTGGSSISTVEALREEGKGIVTDIVSIFSYDFAAAKEQALAANVHLHPIVTLADLLQVAENQNRLNLEEVREVVRFVKEPQHWR